MALDNYDKKVVNQEINQLFMAPSDLVQITQLSDENKRLAETVLNMFEEVFKTPRIPADVYFMCLEFMQLYKSVMYRYHMYCLERCVTGKNKEQDHKIDHHLRGLILQFKNAANNFHKLAEDAEHNENLQLSMELLIHDTRALVFAFMDDCTIEPEEDEPEEEPAKNPRKVPPDFFDDDDSQDYEEAFKEQQVLQAKEISHIKYATTRITMHLDAFLKVIVFVVWALFICRLVCGFMVGGKYSLGQEYIAYGIAIVILHLVTIVLPFNWEKTKHDEEYDSDPENY